MIDITSFILMLQASNGDTEIVDYFQSKFKLKTTDWHRSIEYAACRKQFDIVRYMASFIPHSIILSENTVAAVAKHGDVAMLEWLFTRNQSQTSSFKMMDLASKHNRLDNVKWLHENRTEGCSKAAMIYASTNGNIQLVKWLHENRTEGCDRSAMNNASANGHFETIEWLSRNRSEGCSGRALNQASLNGHLSVVQFMCANYIDSIKDQLQVALLNAASFGHINIVKNESILQDRETIQDSRCHYTCEVQAVRIRQICPNDLEEIIDLCLNVNKIKMIGLYDVVEQLLIESKTTLRLDIRPVVKSGDIDMLKLLIKYQHKYDHANITIKNKKLVYRPSTFHINAIAGALSYGDIDMATYLYEELKLIDTNPINRLLHSIESYRFIYDRFPNLFTKDMIDSVVSSGQLDSLKFILEKIQINEATIQRAFHLALEFGQFPTLKYLGSLQSQKICSKISYRYANKMGYFTILNYLKNNNYKIV
ncbi:hypothetical protein PPL_04346 [Heterostelium album PN500]|uniref:Ankyrin repeat-containing protein n=1 Tax=Heterostelium pallidum (strain ATCC 26659 / Pp 5 / PN500) TaxID=670386 RepID=D3B7B0_HETP5|nr:hypothetical protein PPL_04346 [Heterostelium album PN500]EFA82653.1 hypothetical protein PPL_04346 [Heterostelium album PN500]|eukprot:XP_020434770.1 hypothetical protein PPL_04346 [Heterostelium album PN500]